METVSIPAAEAADFEEYKQRKKRLELKARMRNMEPTLLRRNASTGEIRSLCEQARRHSFVCVCVQPVYVRTCRNLLKGSGVGISCLVGGNSESTLKSKLYECKCAFRDGASEIDFIPAVSAVANGNYAYLKKEVKKVIAKARGKTVKVRLDSFALPPDSFFRAAQAAVDGGAKFLSVCADEELVEELRRRLKKPCEIKVWGVETPERFRSMLALGCARIGSELAEDIFHSMESETFSGTAPEGESVKTEGAQ